LHDHIPTRQQERKLEVLTWREGNSLEEGNERFKHQVQAVQKMDNIDSKLSFFTASFSNEVGVQVVLLVELFIQGYKADKFHNDVLQALRSRWKQHPEITLVECSEQNNHLYYREKKFVPNHLPLLFKIIKEYHDSPSAGHPGWDKTFDLITWDYYWPKMRENIARYVCDCHNCRQSKLTHHAPYGVLKPLPLPNQPWEELSMDIVTGLPLSEGFDTIMVIIDRLTKQQHLVPCHKTTNAKDVAKIYLRELWKHHDLSVTGTVV
jgi:hypothetical protein